MLRGGALASTLLSTLPLWKGMDPLPLLAARRKRKEKAKGHKDTQAMDKSQVRRQAEGGADAESMFTQSFSRPDDSRDTGQS